MIVFKNYFKIVRNNLGMILTFLFISIFIGIANTQYIGSSEPIYSDVKPKIAIINRDENSKITNNFVKYLKSNFVVIKIKDNKKSIQDSLYGHKIDLIVIIENDFGKELLEGKEPNIKIKKSIEASNEYTNLLINRYLKIANLYVKTNMTEEEIIKNISKDIKKEVHVDVLKTKTSGLNKLAVFYSFQNYSALSILIMIIGTIMSIFNRKEIKKRNRVSSLKSESYSIQLLLGHIALALSYCLIIIGVCTIIYQKYCFTINNIFLILNLLIFVLSVSSMAYLIGIFVKNSNVVAGVQNVIALGLSFISGCFMPMEFIDKNIITLAKFFPSYWFIKGNYEIVKIGEFTLKTLNPIIKGYIIILFYAMIYFVVAIIINKKKHN